MAFWLTWVSQLVLLDSEYSTFLLRAINLRRGLLVICSGLAGKDILVYAQTQTIDTSMYHVLGGLKVLDSL